LERSLRRAAAELAAHRYSEGYAAAGEPPRRGQKLHRYLRQPIRRSDADLQARQGDHEERRAKAVITHSIPPHNERLACPAIRKGSVLCFLRCRFVIRQSSPRRLTTIAAAAASPTAANACATASNPARLRRDSAAIMARSSRPWTASLGCRTPSSFLMPHAAESSPRQSSVQEAARAAFT